MIESANPVVSVCVITYNHVKFIKAAIESILQQQANFYWNIIIADDCSTDGTTAIVKEYAVNYPDRIQLITHEKNVGLHQNFIDLFTAPQSKYVAFLDGDDIWTDTLRLQKQVDFLEQHSEYAMVYGRHGLMDEAGNPKPYRRIPPYKSGYIFKDIMLCKFLPPMAAALMRNSEIQKIYKNKNEPGIDFYLIATLCKNNKVAYMNESFFCYRINAASITNSQKPFMSNLFVKNMSLFQNEYPGLVKKGIKNGQLKELYHHAEKEPGFKSFFLLLKKFRFSPLYLRQLAKSLLHTPTNNPFTKGTQTKS